MLDGLAYLLSLILNPCYALTGNWWVAILLFTIIVKIILFPMSLWCQKNSIQLVCLMPALNQLKVKYYGDKETIGEQQTKLYKENHYHPLLSLIPLAVQIIVLIGLINVVHGITDSGDSTVGFIALTPIVDGGLSWIMPLIAGLSAVCLAYASNHINPLQKEQTRQEQLFTNGVSIGISLVLGIFVPTGLAFYWVCSNLTAVLTQALCNICIKPKKYINYEELAASKKELEALESTGSSKSKQWWKSNPLAKREKADYKRFFAIDGKHIVFYSEKSGFYKYYQGAIEYLLDNSNVYIHYVTNDPNDQVFEIAKTRTHLLPYYISENKAITLMMKLDCDLAVTTQPDLDNYYIKRSYVRKDIEYVYMFHAIGSYFTTLTKHALDNFDTIMLVGPHHLKECRRAEEIYNIAPRKLVECGYHLLDEEIAQYEGSHSDAANAGQGDDKDARKMVLIGPSWQKDNILDSCIDDLLTGLLGHGYKVIVRPHPEYTKRYKPRWDELKARYAHVAAEDLEFEDDFTSNNSTYSADILMTDWSNIYCEFAFSTLKPCIFINTPRKIMNPDWEDYQIEPTDTALRNKVGRAVEMTDCKEINSIVTDMLEHQSDWRENIAEVRANTVYNIGASGKAVGEYLLQQIIAKQKVSKKAPAPQSVYEQAAPKKKDAKRKVFKMKKEAKGE